MKEPFLVVTSIANQKHPILKLLARRASSLSIPFIVIGDKKSPRTFHVQGCDFYSNERQKTLDFELKERLPVNHYARKNLGYLIAMSKGAKIIVETDDDNYPLDSFWDSRNKHIKAYLIKEKGWVNVYKYFSDINIWPRGFALEHIKNKTPKLGDISTIYCPIQQGLADGNPDVDAIFRLISPLPIKFKNNGAIALGKNTFCPFNSQNTTWFKEAFPLLYLPSFCSFRMTDIWRSFVAQRVAWSCDWPIVFHQSTMKQERNEHNLMKDFEEEIPGYINNSLILNSLKQMTLQEGVKNIPTNMLKCYEKLISLGLIRKEEIALLKSWLKDIYSFLK